MRYILNRIQFLLFFFIGIPILLFLIYGCCQHKYMITGEGEIILREFKSYTLLKDTINSAFYIEWRLEAEMANVEMYNNFSLNATSCSYEYVNDIIQDSYFISCQTDFVFDGNIVKSGENFVHSGNIKFGSSPVGVHGILFDITDDFLSKAQFNKDFYIFNLAARTSDGIDLKGEFRIYMNL